LVCAGEFTEGQKRALTGEMKHKFGEDLEVDFELVDDIPRTSGGKYRLIANELEF